MLWYHILHYIIIYWITFFHVVLYFVISHCIVVAGSDSLGSFMVYVGSIPLTVTATTKDYCRCITALVSISISRDCSCKGDRPNVSGRFLVDNVEPYLDLTPNIILRYTWGMWLPWECGTFQSKGSGSYPCLLEVFLRSPLGDGGPMTWAVNLSPRKNKYSHQTQ